MAEAFFYFYFLCVQSKYLFWLLAKILENNFSSSDFSSTLNPNNDFSFLSIRTSSVQISITKCHTSVSSFQEDSKTEIQGFQLSSKTASIGQESGGRYFEITS